MDLDPPRLRSPLQLTTGHRPRTRRTKSLRLRNPNKRETRGPVGVQPPLRDARRAPVSFVRFDGLAAYAPLPARCRREPKDYSQPFVINVSPRLTSKQGHPNPAQPQAKGSTLEHKAEHATSHNRPMRRMGIGEHIEEVIPWTDSPEGKITFLTLAFPLRLRCRLRTSCRFIALTARQEAQARPHDAPVRRNFPAVRFVRYGASYRHAAPRKEANVT